MNNELPEVSTSELDGVRYLHLGTEWVQGSMEIKKPFAIELDYVQRMMAWLLWADLRDLVDRDWRSMTSLGATAGNASRPSSLRHYMRMV
jgi:spermidine synthase